MVIQDIGSVIHIVGETTKSYKHFPKELYREVCERYLAGESASELAISYGRSHHTITRVLRKNDVSIRNTRMGNFTDEEKLLILGEWENGVALRLIREKYQTSVPILKQLIGGAGYNLNREAKLGPKNHQWRGGRRVSSQGYILVWADPNHPFYESMSQGKTDRTGARYFSKHRIVMAEFLNRSLEAREQVHHMDGNRSNNEIENLQLRTTGNHGPGQCAKCKNCGSQEIEYLKL